MLVFETERPRGQPSHVSNGSGIKEEEAYLQQPPHTMRAWSEQASDGGYGAGPMSTAVSDSFFPNYYPPNMSYPFMSQGMGGSEGAWSSGADTMFGMGYDYSNMYSGFGFPFNNWDYSGDYWGSSQPVRKDQRGYPAEDAYYPPELIPADSYGMVNGGGPPPTATATATTAPVNSQEPVVAEVEHGIRDMRLAYRKDNVMPPHQPQQCQRQQQQPPQQQHPPQHHLQHVVAEGFSGEPSFMMPPSPVTATAASSSGQSSMNVGNNSSNAGGSDQSSGQSSSKKTSWAAIASQPARPQLQMRPRTIPRAPVHPGKSHNMDIGTWDTRGNPSRTVNMTMSQPLPNQPPSSIAARYSRQPLIGQRQAMPPPTAASVTVSNSSNNANNSSGGGSSASGANNNSGMNSSSSYSSGGGGNPGVDNNNGNNTSAINDNNNSGTNPSNDGGSVVTAIGSSSADSNNSNMSNSGVGNNSSSSSAYSSGYSSNASGNVSDSTNRAVVNVSASMNGTHGGSSGDSSSSSQAPAPVADSVSSEKSSTFYNPKEFVLNHKSARYFVIKSYSEDDIHRSIKYAVWCSTDHGNRRLDAAFREREGKGPVYLIFSVNGSGHFCGVAQMMTPVDYNKSTGIWHQDKWKGQIEVKWVYVKDVPNNQLRHIRLENNENKPVTNSRDTQEVPPEKGKQVLRIMHSFKATTSIFDDFSHYEKRQEEDRLLSMHRDTRGSGGGGHQGQAGDRDYHGGGGGGNRDRGDRDHHHRGGDRDNNHYNNHRGNNNDHHHNYRNDYNNRGGDRDGGRDNRDHHHNNRYNDGGRGDNRNDNRDRGGPRGGFDREIRGRPGSNNDRENRRGGFRQH